MLRAPGSGLVLFEEAAERVVPLAEEHLPVEQRDTNRHGGEELAHQRRIGARFALHS